MTLYKYSWILLMLLVCAACDQAAEKSHAEIQLPSMEQTDTQENITFDPAVLEGFDWQAHRGGRGLFPENTTVAFIQALEIPEVTTLEMDIVVNSEGHFVVSHEPWISAAICAHSDGTPLTESQGKALSIYQMTYSDIRKFDCGSKRVSEFPQQKKVKAHKPTLISVFRAVETYCKQKKYDIPYFNIEIKSQPQWYGSFVPEPAAYVESFLEYIQDLNPALLSRMSVQSFDPAILETLHQIAPYIPLVYLVENEHPLAENLDKLSFAPAVYSPHYSLVTAELVNELHEQKIRLVVWTVNDVERMKELRAMGVDGIITDYPNRISLALQSKQIE